MPSGVDASTALVGVQDSAGATSYVPAGQAARLSAQGLARIITVDEQKRMLAAEQFSEAENQRRLSLTDEEYREELIRTYSRNVRGAFFSPFSQVEKGLAYLRGGDQGVKEWQEQTRLDKERHADIAEIAEVVGLGSQFVATAGLGSAFAGARAAEAAATAARATEAAGMAERAMASGLMRSLPAAERAADTVRRAHLAMDATEAAGGAQRAASLRNVVRGASAAEQVATKQLLLSEAEAAGAARAHSMVEEAARLAQKAATVQPGMAARYGWAAAEGAMVGLNDHIRKDAFGEQKFNFADAAASGIMGAALGVGGRFAGEFVGAKLASGLTKAGVAAEERTAIKTLQGLGFSANDMRMVTENHGSYSKFLQTIEQELGVPLAKVEQGKLGDAIAGLGEKLGKSREALMDLASKSGARPNTLRVESLLREIEEAEKGFDPIYGASRVDKFRRDILPALDNTIDAKDRLGAMDKIQSTIGKMARERETPFSPTFSQSDANYLKKIQGILKDEIDQSLMRVGDPKILESYKSVNKAYSYYRTLDKYVAKDMKKAAASAVGMAEDRSTFGKFMTEVLPHSAGYAAVSGNPMALVYPLAFSAVRGAVSSAVNTLDRGMAGIMQSMTASAAASTSFKHALDSLSTSAITRTGSAVAGKVSSSGKKDKKAAISKAVSPELAKFVDKKEFDKLVMGITDGSSMAQFSSKLAGFSPDAESQANAFGSKLSSNIQGMLPPQKPYLVGPGAYVEKQWKVPSVIDPDEMKVLRYLDSVINPLNLASRVVNGTASPEHIKAVKDMYPDLDARMRNGLMEYLLDPKKSMDKLALSPQVRASVSNYLGHSVDAINSPEFARTLSDIRAQEAKMQEEASAGAGKATGGDVSPNHADYTTATERIEK
jgi:hypothetical protein